ncbi:transcription initiation factor TFIID subunit 7-like [Artemia franciscana]|uniref:TAFII55 protein conserved region domain-containing protein n=1 Tax=Artemia franciscana TaxID=6661 RepID=A0AA88IBQ4_ARTSF|nr:hypothetical protein QYM36_001543 [Artemia franciscana]
MYQKEVDVSGELENQFLLRLPRSIAEQVRNMITNVGPQQKDKLSIKMEPDMRKGFVCFNNYVMNAKLVDLPCVIESWKTIDRKSFYKTADICQMLVGLEGEEVLEEDTTSKKKKDINKVDKKYIWPHGITPPLKNVRRRRFRKTLKKKHAEAPEIEKEVKRLLRSDNEAVSVRWEVVTEEDETKPKLAADGSVAGPIATGTFVSAGVADIFGEDLSDSEEESSTIIRESADESDSMSSSLPSMQIPNRGASDFLTQFSSEMFNPSGSKGRRGLSPVLKRKVIKQEVEDVNDEAAKDALLEQVEEARNALKELQMKRKSAEMELPTIQNMGLKARFLDNLENLKMEEAEKQKEYNRLLSMI